MLGKLSANDGMVNQNTREPTLTDFPKSRAGLGWFRTEGESSSPATPVKRWHEGGDGEFRRRC